MKPVLIFKANSDLMFDGFLKKPELIGEDSEGFQLDYLSSEISVNIEIINIKYMKKTKLYFYLEQLK